MDKINEIKEELLKYKIKPSLIRIKVYEYLKRTREHPDAEKIYRVLAREIPTLSMTSIYNTLKVLTKNGAIKEIMIEEDEIRYDGYNERHAHFKCVNCGKLYDLKLKCKSCFDAIEIKKAKIFDEHIYFVGICDKCIKKGEKNYEENIKTR
jgi:Fe2+ or Zn2+ uptake regulation protein